jgi:hypothetical protein
MTRRDDIDEGAAFWTTPITPYSIMNAIQKHGCDKKRKENPCG